MNVLHRRKPDECEPGCGIEVLFAYTDGKVVFLSEGYRARNGEWTRASGEYTEEHRAVLWWIPVADVLAAVDPGTATFEEGQLPEVPTLVEINDIIERYTRDGRETMPVYLELAAIYRAGQISMLKEKA